jgi:hypothetical protein
VKWLQNFFFIVHLPWIPKLLKIYM